MEREFSLRRRMLFTAAAGVGAAAALSGTARAAHSASSASSASAVEPDIDGTGAWGARAPGGTISVLNYRPSMIIVHHTVSENTGDFSRAQAHAHSQWVQDLHMDGNGWVDTGYNFLVSRGGWITEGRHRSLETLSGGTSFVFGAHTSGQNDVGIGIANEGAYHDGATPPAAQWEVLVQLCAYVASQYAIPATEIYGHMDFGSTLCPGIFHEMLPRLRDEVGDAIG
ncbi:peptidoglycan recognition protein family protein [Streptomyces profundus]|uniref:peptidoglycan recognition protein family protein n=1 Tax=Streptomyces profundus TaxID=2867410 RepID=UPI001D168C05|nr:peptidoglycan recognition family protein [Streptomyces sp. MA3_2.13]UED86495.1 peptidoglycan recognition protein family protein [Streptomyces sp. MA3_2.13]